MSAPLGITHCYGSAKKSPADTEEDDNAADTEEDDNDNDDSYKIWVRQVFYPSTSRPCRDLYVYRFILSFILFVFFLFLWEQGFDNEREIAETLNALKAFVKDEQKAFPKAQVGCITAYLTLILFDRILYVTSMQNYRLMLLKMEGLQGDNSRGQSASGGLASLPV